MEKKLLYKCNDIVLTEYIVDALKTNGIVSFKHDEKITQRTGAYGADEGLAIYVLEQDYDKALDIIKPIVTETSHNTATMFCPKCGGDDIEFLPNPFYKYRTGLLSFSIVLELIALVYFAWNSLFSNISSPVGNILAVISLLISIILVLLAGKTKNRYKCKKCGKTFSRD